MDNVQPNAARVNPHYYQTDASIDELLDELKDSSTLDLFENPVILRPCNHRINKVTAQNWLGARLRNNTWEKNQTCPNCRQVVVKCVDDLLTKNLVEKIQKLNIREAEHPPVQIPVVNQNPQDDNEELRIVDVHNNLRPIIQIDHGKTRTNIGTRAALLAGLSEQNARNKVNIAHVRLSQDKGLSLNFKNAADAEYLMDALEGKNFVSTSYQSVNYESAQHGMFLGNVSISDPNEIARFIMQHCGLNEETVKRLVAKSANNTEFGDAILRAAKNAFFSGKTLNQVRSTPIKASDGVNFAIASAAAVMCEGGLTTSEAKQRHLIPSVGMREDGLYITFPVANAVYAKSYAGALSKAGYKSISYTRSDEQRLIKFSDAKEVAHFMKKRCHINSLKDIENYLQSIHLDNAFSKAVVEHYRDM